jgi:hypothetical protein
LGIERVLNKRDFKWIRSDALRGVPKTYRLPLLLWRRTKDEAIKKGFLEVPLNLIPFF